MRTTDYSPLRFILGLLVVILLGFATLTSPAKSASISTDVLHLLDSRPNLELGLGLTKSVEWFVGAHSLEVTNTSGEKETALDVNTGFAFYLNGVDSDGFYTRFNAFVARVQEDSEASRSYEGPIKWSLGYAMQFGNGIRLKLGVVPGYFSRSGDFHRTLLRDDSEESSVGDDADSHDFEVRLGYKL